MTRAEYIADILSLYDIADILSKKNDAEVLRLRRKQSDGEMVLRSYAKPIPAYLLLKELRHPNIPEIYDVIHLDDGLVVLEEFIDGITVADVLMSGNYSYRSACEIIRSVCAALTLLHSHDIIHRDIKPENIVVTKDRRIKLLDFNASRLYCDEKSHDTVTLGTIGYAPPEQFGISQSDEKSDIYAVGVLLNVMLTGRHPSEKLADGKAAKIILKCTSIDPNSRFASAQKLIEAL